MPQIFPFTRGAPGAIDYIQGQRLNPAEINAIDKNAAQAADGLIWSDATILKNWLESFVSNGSIIFWDAYTGTWVFAGTAGGAPIAYASSDGKPTWNGLSPTAGTNWNTTFSGASNGVGSVLLGGGGGTATASKIRQSGDGGATWAARNTVASGTQAVAALCWHAASSKFVAGLDGTATTNIETSADGITWAQATAPNSNPRFCAVSNGTMTVITSNVSTNKLITSTDLVTWTERTLPSTGVWSGVTYNSKAGLWCAAGASSVATSSDGITWGNAGLLWPFPTGPVSICTLGRFFVVGAPYVAGGVNTQSIVISSDLVTWKSMKQTTATGGSVIGQRIASNGNQVVAVTSTLACASLISGF